MILGTTLLMVLVFMLMGTVSTWPHNSSWGYGPSGILGLVVIVIIALVLTGRI